MCGRPTSQKTENVIFDAPTFSAYAVTLAASYNFNLEVKVNFCDDEGNPISADSFPSNKRYYLVATVPGQAALSWGSVDCDYLFYKEINPDGDSECSMTINPSTMAQFFAVYWSGFHHENPLTGSYSGKTIYIQVTETYADGINGNNYKSTEISDGQKMGDYTLRMNGPTSFTLNEGRNETINIDAVKSGYKYEVQAFEADGVTPVNTCGFDDTYYVIAHKANDDDKYFVEALNTESLAGGKQTGIISSFKGKYYIGNVEEYASGDSVVVELVSSNNMLENPEQYKVFEADYFPQGSYPEGKFKVESVTVNPENTKTTIKLVKTPEYNYEVKVKTLQGEETTGDPSGLNLKVMAHSNNFEQNDGYYYASSNLSLSGNDEGSLSWLDDSSVRIVNSDATSVEDLSGSPEKYKDGDTVAERYTMGVSVDDENKLVTITLTELPKYYVKNNLEKINEDTSIDTGKFYIYTDMENADGTHSYYLKKWDSIPETGYQAGETSDAANENPRPYTTDKTVSVKLLKSDEELTLGEDGVIGNYRELTDGQLTDGFKVSYSEKKPNGADHSMTVTLTELKPGQDYPVDIKFINHYDEPVSPELEDTYYLLATLKPADGNGDIVAWALKEVNWDDSATTTVVFENGDFNVCDSEYEATNDTVGFNPEEFAISTRLYRSVDGSALETYNDVNTNGRDDIEGYDFVSNVQELDGNDDPVKSVITLKETTTKTYTINVEGTDQLAATGKKYFVFLKAEHASTDDTFALSSEMDLTGSSSSVIPNNSWVLADGTAGDAFTGNETMNYYIVEADAQPAVQDVIAVLNGGTSETIHIYNQNAIFQNTTAAKFVFEDRERIDDVHLTDITDKLVIKASTATNDYDVKTLMGPGLLYGLTADFYDPEGHLQTNFAVNRLNPCESLLFGWVHPNLSGNPGTIAAASIDDGTYLRIEEDTSLDTIPVVVDPGDAGKVVTGMNNYLDPPAYVVELESSQISNQIVNPIIHYMKQKSAELLAHEDTFEPEIVETEGEVTALHHTYPITCTELDTTAYPSDATIYLDGERYMKYLAQKEALTIKKWPDQVIVFNFDTATNIDLDTFRIQYKNEDNTWRESFSTQSDWQDTSSDGINRTIDFAAQHIVFNCANAKTVQTGGGCGMFFVPWNVLRTEERLYTDHQI